MLWKTACFWYNLQYVLHFVHLRVLHTTIFGGQSLERKFTFLDTSFDSDLDYAVPPDASLPPSTPSRMLMANSSSLDSPRKAAVNNAEKALEKSGYLTKLGGKIKSWRKRYFVLKNGTLSYWKSQVSFMREKWHIIISESAILLS